MALDILNINCPECGKPLKYLSYNAPDEVFSQLYRYKEVYFSKDYDTEKLLKEEDRLKYHCFNCNKSYSSNFKRSKYEEYDRDRVKFFQDYMEYLSDTASDDMMKIFDDNDKYAFKTGHFDYENISNSIKQSFLYNGKHGMIIDYDLIARRAYDKFMIKLNKYKFPKYDYIYVSVCYFDPAYGDYDGLMYYYKTDNKDIFSGDIVLVDRAGQQVKAKVQKVEYFKKKDVPYPLNKTKDVLEVIKDEEKEKEEK